MHGTGAPDAGPAPVYSAVEFTGRWKEFLPIALTNLLLMVVTLGVYRFWATARERQYLWSRTRFVDDRLEWSGTGKEMFLGFLIVLLFLLPMAMLLIFATGLTARGGDSSVIGGLLIFLVYGSFFYLAGVGGFRALRYRLSRTYWHGIRGGSDCAGWGYGWQFVWKTAAGYSLFGLLVPWAKTSLWNDRWNGMSFGRHRFEAAADAQGLMGRWLATYFVPIAGMILFFSIADDLLPYGGDPPPDVAQDVMIKIGLLVVGGYLAYSLASLVFYSAYYRRVADTTSIGGVELEFTARTMDWVKLILGHIGLVIVTLGVGLMFIRYRNWAFTMRHLEASGIVDLDSLLQSLTAAPGEAEGLADAFDIGAI